MKRIFAFTLSTKKDCYEKGDCIFSADGKTVGRVLSRMNVEIDSEHFYYAYDVESDSSTFEKLRSGEMKLYRVDEFSVSECSVMYVNGM